MYNQFMNEVNNLRNIKLTLDNELTQLKQKQNNLINKASLNNENIDSEYLELKNKIELKTIQLENLNNNNLNEKISNEINNRKDLKELATNIINENIKKIDELQKAYDTKKKEIDIMKAKYLKIVAEMGNIKREAEPFTEQIREVKGLTKDKVYYAGMNTYISNLDRIDMYFGISTNEVYKKYNNKEI